MARNGALMRYPQRRHDPASRTRAGRVSARLVEGNRLYLGRGIRTVQRWEREEGLPVHRLDHAKRGSVYASRRELTAWWESRRRPDSAPASTSAAASAAPRELERVTAASAATFWPALSSDARPSEHGTRYEWCPPTVALSAPSATTVAVGRGYGSMKRPC